MTQHDTNSDSRLPPQPHGMVTRAQTVPQNNTAQPPLTSGFGAVIEKERGLQGATEEALGGVSGRHAAEIDRILRHQHARLGANIALLKQRYEALPDPGRFTSWNERRQRPRPSRRAAQRDETKLLPDLIARHTGLRADIEALTACGSDGQRGELILAEVGRHHEEMAWMLTALLKEDAAALPFVEEDGDHDGSSSNARPADERPGQGEPVMRINLPRELR